MAERVALARALATEPDVLLMDEPFAALERADSGSPARRVGAHLGRTGRTIIFVTHNVREAVRLGDRVALLTFRPGRVKQEFFGEPAAGRVIWNNLMSRAHRGTF